jgi:hypothetical protein
MTVTVKRQEKNTWNQHDFIYKEDGTLFAHQSNLNVRNRFGGKKFKYNNKILTVKSWEKVWDITN